MSGILPKLLLPEDTRALQVALKADVQATDASIQGCAGLSDTDKTAWASFRDAAIGYSTVSVKGFGQLDFKTSTMAILFPESLLRTVWGNSSDEFFNRGKAYEAELIDWQKQFKAKGCNVGALHQTTPDEPNPLLELAKWGGIAIAAVAGAYAVSIAAPVVIEGISALKARKALSKKTG